MFAFERQSIASKLMVLRQLNKRIIIAIAGPPAAGKSTLADLVVSDINRGEAGSAALVPMDGYHLDNKTLDQMGRRARKGAPDTFDSVGFVDLIKKLAHGGMDIKYPTFDRENDCVVPDSETISKNIKWIVIEGNYLLLKEEPWCEIKQYCNLTTLLRPSIDVVEARLIKRWRDLGFSKDEAEGKAFDNDIPNARYVLNNRATADIEFGQ